MPKKARIVSYSGKDIKRMTARGESKTDCLRVKAKSQAEVERLADEEEGPLSADWESTVVIGFPKLNRLFTSGWIRAF
jgi:hypothetical protein